MRIYITGTIGIECAARLFEENSDFLRKYFPNFFIRQTEELFAEAECEQNIQAIKEKVREFLLANKCKCIYISTIAEGGIFGALWRACAELACGCEVNVGRIPIRQEVVEICELFSENPYESDSSGCLLVICDGVSECESAINCLSDEQTVMLSEIGHTTNKKDRLVINGKNKRFLTPPKRQSKDIANRKRQSGI